LSCGFEADGANEGIEIIDNTLIEAIKLRSPLGLKPCVCFDGAEKACGEWRVIRDHSGYLRPSNMAPP
jgi:hypothetical protein